jgi:tritrans,polycis-undecaprenyl-diphosphate synthase [geranylgeranyl-diphosphate specific]
MFLPLTKKKQNVNMPNHIALTTNGILRYSKKNKKELEESWKKSFEVILKVIKFQIDRNIPIITFDIFPMGLVKKNNFLEISEYVASFFNELKRNHLILNNKVKVSVLGKWYDLPNNLVESIKELTSETKDYDSFFVNFCMNYNGREEIIDAMKVIAMKIKNGSLDPGTITKNDVKENIYSSYFIPPDLMIVNGGLQSTRGLLLWDSLKTKIYFTDKLWPEFKADYISSVISKIYSKKE